MQSTKGQSAPVAPVPVDTSVPDSAPAAAPASATAIDTQTIEDTFAALKTLMSTVEKLQQARQSVGDIKPLLIRLLDGELLSGEELETLKSGIGGLGKLVKLYGSYQEALAQAQPARTLLDTMIKS
ncbi:hypothetical protein C7271_10330 [filamentous cyanobacterium CCP5]|nr:hypothetical protein C7271_10330 [filamentous cyanobacterium CCP5]